MVRVRLWTALAALALLLLSVVWLAPADASGQGSGEMTNLTVSSDAPGDLAISWDPPDPAPSDYRIRWAVEGEGWLSYKKPNEANRGNEYPGGEVTSITLTGLTPGVVVEVQARTRYESGGRNDKPWSGPWSDTVSGAVAEEEEAQGAGGGGTDDSDDEEDVQGADGGGTPITGSSSEPADGDLPADSTTTGAVAEDRPALGTIHQVDGQWDTDWFAADLVAGQSYVIEALGASDRDHCTLRAPILDGVRDADGEVVAGTEWSDPGRTTWPALSFTAPSGGRHYVAVTGEPNSAGVGSYVLALTEGGEGSDDRIDNIGSKGCPQVDQEEQAPLSGAARSANAVRNLAATALFSDGSSLDQQVLLTWDGPQNKCSIGEPLSGSTKVYRGLDSDSLTEIATMECSRVRTELRDYRLEPETTYYYRVDAAPTGSYAQSDVVSVTARLEIGPNILLSNLDQHGSVGHGLSYDAGQSFTTGSSEFGYALDRVSFNANLQSGSLPLTIYHDDDGSIGDQLAELGSVTSRGLGLYTYVLDVSPHVVLTPDTTFWLVFGRANAIIQPTFSNQLDTGGEDGWSLGASDRGSSPIQVRLEGNPLPSPYLPGAPSISVQPGSTVTLVSNLRQPLNSAAPTPVIGPLYDNHWDQAQAFITGPSPHGYGLASITLELRKHRGSDPDPALILAVHRDGDGAPGEVLYTLKNPPDITAITTGSLREFTFTAPAHAPILRPDITYWLVIQVDHAGVVAFIHFLGDLDADSLPGWSIAGLTIARDRGTTRWYSGFGALRIKLEGEVFSPATAEPDEWDFPARVDTPGLLRVGGQASGTLTEDYRLVEREPAEGESAEDVTGYDLVGDCCGDWFRLQGCIRAAPTASRWNSGTPTTWAAASRCRSSASGRAAPRRAATCGTATTTAGPCSISAPPAAAGPARVSSTFRSISTTARPMAWPTGRWV